MVEPRTWPRLDLNTKFGPGAQVRQGFSGLKSKGKGLHLEGVGGDTLGSTLALPASWAEVGGANGGASDLAET